MYCIWLIQSAEQTTWFICKSLLRNNPWMWKESQECRSCTADWIEPIINTKPQMRKPLMTEPLRELKILWHRTLIETELLNCPNSLAIIRKILIFEFMGSVLWWLFRVWGCISLLYVCTHGSPHLPLYKYQGEVSLACFLSYLLAASRLGS